MYDIGTISLHSFNGINLFVQSDLVSICSQAIPSVQSDI